MEQAMRQFEGSEVMSVTDGLSFAEDISRGINCAMRESIKCEEKATLLVEVMGEEAFDYIARHHGYAKERTCRLVDTYPDSGTCGECGAKLRPAIVRPGKAELNYCTGCGAKVRR